MSSLRAVVIGGGLAGLAAALELASKRAQVTLVEARPRLGGATHSFHRDGVVVDNGQHVFLRCYDEYRKFLRQIGADHLVSIQNRLDVPVLTPGNVTNARLYRKRGLPAPLHLTSCLSRYRALPRSDRAKVVRAMLELRTLDVRSDDLDNESFGAWLRNRGQSEESIAALWDLLVVAALNARCDEASLQLAVKVFQTALLTSASAADIGVPRVPLSDLHGNPAHRTLTDFGARVLLRTKATRIERLPDGLRVATVDGSIDADAVVLATPHQRAAELLPPHAVSNQLAELGTSSIVNAHFVFDRKVTDLPLAAAVGSLVQWTFDRSRIIGLPGTGQYLAVSLSAAENLIDLPAVTIRSKLMPEFIKLFPAAAGARIDDFFVTRERHATFRQAPGSKRHRPGPTTMVPGLFLAGAWTDTGWPDTMEGAVRSGYAAAHLALSVNRSAPVAIQPAAIGMMR